MGARVACDKTYAMSTSRHVRARLRREHFQCLGGKVGVRLDARDLGTHMALGQRAVGTTINQRIARAVTCCRRLAAIAAPFAVKL
eukprot:8546013-Alexandrium_andersonii.AAC.1